MKKILMLLLFVGFIANAQLDKNVHPEVINKTSTGIGDQAYTLNPISSYYDDVIFVFKNNESTGVFTINSFSGETIDGANSKEVRCTNDFITIIKDVSNSSNWVVINKKEHCFNVYLAGQYLLDPNEINGLGVIGYTDNTNAQDLGDVGAANLSRLAGGWVFPYDVRIKRMLVWHRNNNAVAEAWGWVVFSQQKTDGNNDVTTTFMLDESFDRGVGQFNLRDYLNLLTQYTEINSFENDIVFSGDTVGLAVGAPTAVTTNRYVQIMSGFIEFEKIN